MLTDHQSVVNDCQAVESDECAKSLRPGYSTSAAGETVATSLALTLGRDETPNSAELSTRRSQNEAARLRNTATSNTGQPSGPSFRRHSVVPISPVLVTATEPGSNARSCRSIGNILPRACRMLSPDNRRIAC